LKIENGGEDNEISRVFGGGEEEGQEKENEREENGFFQSKQKVENETGNLQSVQRSFQGPQSREYVHSKINVYVSQFFYFLSLSFLFIITMLITSLTYVIQTKKSDQEIKLVSIVYKEV